MSETKVQINERKIRKGIRKSTEAQQRQMWKKLTTKTAVEKPTPFDPTITYRVTRSGKRNVW